MKKVVIIPDSFKGTISSQDICDAVASAVASHFPICETVKIPVADGGEGTVDAFLGAVSGERVSCTVTGPHFTTMKAEYALLDGGDTAVIEMAACAGLPLVGVNKNPAATTTFGVGELIKDALGRGIKTLILAIGGSATNDGGCGMASALGVRFFNSVGQSFVPVGGTLSKISHFSMEQLDSRLNEVKVITMCDVTNPLCGEKGAAAVFGPQKGAGEEMVKLLDQGLENLAKAVQDETGKSILDIEGAGAAGGMGGGSVAFLDASLQSGIETVLDIVGFDQLAEGADLVFTGEGKVDSQSRQGKVVDGVSKRCKAMGLPLIVLAGSLEDPLDDLYNQGVSALFNINRTLGTLEDVKPRTKENIFLTVDSILRVMTALGNGRYSHDQ